MKTVQKEAVAVIPASAPAKKSAWKQVAGSALRAGGGWLGGAVAPMIGLPSNLGAAGGSWLGGMVSKLVGFGSYNVVRNSLHPGAQTVMSQPVPTFRGAADRDDGVIITHSEYLADVIGSTAFTVKRYPVNPGLSSTFPWLSVVASGFTEYELLGCVFEYRPTSGNIAAASPALGVVLMASNYNVHEANFATKVQMASTQYCVSGLPCNEILHPIECKRFTNLTNRGLLRHTSISNEMALYDLCNFQIATEGMQSEYTVGELWVSYHVRLTRPSLDSALTYTDDWESTTIGELTTLEPILFSKRTASTLGTELWMDDQFDPGTFRLHVLMPPLSGDYMAVMVARATLGTLVPPMAEDWVLGEGLTALDWMTGVSQIHCDIAAFGAVLATYHVDGATWALDDQVSRRARSLQVPREVQSLDGKMKMQIFIIKFPDGLGASALGDVSVESSAMSAIASLIRGEVQRVMASDQTHLLKDFDKISVSSNGKKTPLR